jgi:hypothetical protein
MHHNIIDNRLQKLSKWGENPFPPFLWLNHSATGNHPRKNYNNTVFWGPDVEDKQLYGLNHNTNQDNTVTGKQAAHEVFNNIIIRQDTQRYTPSNVGAYSNTHRTDFAGANLGCDPGLTNEFWDYNCYVRDVPTDSGGAFSDALFIKIRKGRMTDERSFATLAAFRASDLFDLTKQDGAKREGYAPGFEANGTTTAPTMPSFNNINTSRLRYRPSPNSVVTVATSTSLSGANWWSNPSWGDDFFNWNDGEKTLAPSPWKGALNPNGSTLPIGVQDP